MKNTSGCFPFFTTLSGDWRRCSGCFPILQLLTGIGFIVMSRQGDGGRDGPLPFVGEMFVAIAIISMTVCWTIAACIIATGRFLAKRRHYTFCLGTAGVECIFMPFGTVLGVFTIIVLVRESVRAMFPIHGTGKPTA
jgi:hypothetical protein